MDQAQPWNERFQCPSCSKSFVRKAHMLRHQQQRQRIFIVICDRAVSDSEAQTSLKDHFRAIFAPNASNEGSATSCSLCAASILIFNSDVLRAHQFRCKERGEAPVPEGQSKGRKRSSCLSCVKLRTRCDQETPCGRCQELGKECVRGWPHQLIQPVQQN